MRWNLLIGGILGASWGLLLLAAVINSEQGRSTARTSDYSGSQLHISTKDPELAPGSLLFSYKR